MKKLFTAFILAGILASSANAFFCSGKITEAFTKLYKKVELTFQITNNQMKNQVIPNAKESLAKIQEENEVLKQLIASQKAISIKQAELIFELNKKIQLR